MAEDCKVLFIPSLREVTSIIPEAVSIPPSRNPEEARSVLYGSISELQTASSSWPDNNENPSCSNNMSTLPQEGGKLWTWFTHPGLIQAALHPHTSYSDHICDANACLQTNQG